LPPREEFTPFPDVLVERAVEKDTAIPFQHYVSSLPVLSLPYGVYRRLLGDMRTFNEGSVSYNFVMTKEWIFLSPRKKDDYIGEGFKIGVNSTGMVGLLLTKSEEESQFLERIGPVSVLEDVGISWSPQQGDIVRV
jgi:ATP adenylyltransferase/5',5'''-P-1,P-4-tetraphosphate phosphorylase II